VPASRLRRHAGLVLVTLLAVGVSWGMKAQCLIEGGWQDGEQYVELCYSDAPVMWHQRDLVDGAAPYLDSDFEYPVLTGLLVGGLAAGTHALGGGVQTFLALNAVAAAVLAVALLAALAPLVRDRRRLWWWAAAPPLVLYAVWNWDLLAALFLVVGLVAHQRDRPGLAGAALGLGTAAKLFPAIAVPVLALEHLRRHDRAAAGRLVGSAAGAWLVVNLPVAIAAPGGWWHFYDMSIHRPAMQASTWRAVEQIPGVGVPGGLIGVLATTTLLAGAAVIVVTGTRRLPVDQTWRLVLPLTAWFLVTNKVYSPQFDLWLVPMLVLLPRAAPLLAFFAAGSAVVVLEMLHLGGNEGHGPAPGPGLLALAVGARVGVLLWVITLSLRPETYRHPESSSRESTSEVGSSMPSQMGMR
jgi:hypothetical protein